MNHKRFPESNLIAAERRRLICNWVLEHGSVNVSEIANMIGVGVSTIRNDLNVLNQEGKIIRSHGGAIAKDTDTSRLPYSHTRNENLPQKAAIGEAALAYLPETGVIFIGAGTTAYQFAIRIPGDWRGQVITVSPDVALYLVSNTSIQIHLLGGKMRADSHATDGSWASEILELAYWDVTFAGTNAIDPARGITTIDVDAAKLDRKVIERGNKLVMLSDSSKFGCISYARVGPVSLVDVLITDSGINQEMRDYLHEESIEVVIADSRETEKGDQMEA